MAQTKNVILFFVYCRTANQWWEISIDQAKSVMTLPCYLFLRQVTVFGRLTVLGIVTTT